MTTVSGFFVELDDVLVERARRGDVDALEVVYQTYSNAVYTLARRLCGSPEDGEEVLQETFLEVVRKVGSYRGQGAFGAWLRKVAVSRALMHLRRARVRGGEWTTEDPEQVENRPAVRMGSRLEARIDAERALQRLPETARIVVWLHDVEGMTHAEIARLLDRSESFSKSQLSRAYRRLRLWMRNQESGCHASNDRRAVGAAGR